MKRYYDIFHEFAIVTASKTFVEFFAIGWNFNEMHDYMCDKYLIDTDSIMEIRHTYVKRYKLLKND